MYLHRTPKPDSGNQYLATARLVTARLDCTVQSHVRRVEYNPIACRSLPHPFVRILCLPPVKDPGQRRRQTEGKGSYSASTLIHIVRYRIEVIHEIPTSIDVNIKQVINLTLYKAFYAESIES